MPRVFPWRPSTDPPRRINVSEADWVLSRQQRPLKYATAENGWIKVKAAGKVIRPYPALVPDLIVARFWRAFERGMRACLSGTAVERERCQVFTRATDQAWPV